MTMNFKNSLKSLTSTKKRAMIYSMRGDVYVKRDSNLYYASGSINCITINDYSRYLELVILKFV